MVSIFTELLCVAKLLSPAIFWLGILGVIPAIYAFFSMSIGTIEFGASAILAVLISLFLHKLGSKAPLRTSLRVLFLFTTLMWLIMTLLASIPIYLCLEDLNWPAAIFESASGLSTTGATVITHLDSRPPAILLWRSILQFLGGIGFVVVAVAILPNMAMGGMNIFKTESTSFDGNSKLTPHIKTMALSLLSWYLFTLIACSLLYIYGGFDPFLAINTALCTVSTGGMMPIDASMNGAPVFVQYTCMIFMFLGSIPFMLLLGVFLGSTRPLFRDRQVRAFSIFWVFLSALVALSLVLINHYDLERAIRVASFNVLSILSSTGFVLEDYSAWNTFSTMVFLLFIAIGGCSGSTAGGIKIFRIQICYSMFKTQLVKTLHPHAVLEPQFNGRNINSDTLRSVITYLVSYILIAMLSCAIASVLGLSLTDAVAGTISSLSNIGPALGAQLGPSGNFAHLSSGLHLLFSADMILGRLEILPILLCFTRMFWKL